MTDRAQLAVGLLAVVVILTVTFAVAWRLA